VRGGRGEICGIIFVGIDYCRRELGVVIFAKTDSKPSALLAVHSARVVVEYLDQARPIQQLTKDLIVFKVMKNKNV